MNKVNQNMQKLTVNPISYSKYVILADTLI